MKNPINFNKNGSAVSRFLVTTVVAVLMFLAAGSHAVLIDFDDLESRDISWPLTDENALSDEYLAQGLLIDGGFLAYWNPDYEGIISSPHFLFGGNVMRLTFVDKSPVFVSMYVSSVFDYANIINVYGPDGLITTRLTTGSTGGESDNDPFIPWEYITFEAPQGITSMTFEGFYNMRWSTLIDDLTYEYASVPEPATLLMFLSGLLALVLCRQPQLLGQRRA